MASYEKIIKYVVEQIQLAMSPLKTIAENQQTLIQQNEAIIQLLEKISAAAGTPRPESPPEENSNY